MTSDSVRGDRRRKGAGARTAGAPHAPAVDPADLDPSAATDTAPVDAADGLGVLASGAKTNENGVAVDGQAGRAAAGAEGVGALASGAKGNRDDLAVGGRAGMAAAGADGLGTSASGAKTKEDGLPLGGRTGNPAGADGLEALLSAARANRDGLAVGGRAGIAAADAVVRLLGPPNMCRLEIAANTGIPPELTRRFWHALGFAAAPSEDDARYTLADQEAITRTVSLLQSGKVDEQLALAMTRAIARTLDRLASWQTSLVMESYLRGQVGDRLHPAPGADAASSELPDDLAASLALDREMDEHLWHRRLSPEASRKAGEAMLAMVDEMEPLIIYAWRRHLAATIGRLMTQNDPEEGLGLGMHRSVAFADMVGFTTLVRRLSERQLTSLVRQFEASAAEIVSRHGGRIVKTLGDEVLYVTDEPPQAAAIALDLLEAVGEDQGMPQLRVGMAYGQILPHLGDVFGTTVNRASRLTNVAQPDTVVMDEAMAAHLARAPGFTTSELPPRALRGLGVTGVWRLARHGAADPPDATVEHSG